MRTGAAAARERRGIQLARAEKLHESCKSTSQCLRKCLIEAESLILHVNPRILREKLVEICGTFLRFQGKFCATPT